MPYGSDPTDAPAAPAATLPTSTYDPDTGRRVPYVAPVTPLKPPLETIEHYESGGKNLPNYRYDKTHTASGFWQITDTNWKNYGPQLGIDVEKYPTAMSAPRDDQQKVAQKMYDEQGYKPWAPYNPALARAIGGGYGKDPSVAAGKWNVDPSAISYAQARGDGSVWWMTPEEYRAAIEETPSSTKRRSLLKSLMGGDAIADLPEIETANKDGKVTIVGHDGSNRAKIASEELGPDGLIPVFVKGITVDKAPSWITDAHGNERPFNFAPVAKVTPPAPGVLDRIGTGLADVALGALQMTAGGAVPPEATVNMTPQQAAQVSPEAVQGAMDKAIADRERRIESERAVRGETGTDWWRVAGNVVGTAPMAAFGPLGVGGRAGMLLGAAGGALGSALSPVTTGDLVPEKAKEIALGGAVGAALGGAGNAAARLIAPKIIPAAQRLLDRGVELLPGQLKGGIIRGVEEASRSVPISGEAVAAAQRRAVEGWNRAVYKDILDQAPLSGATGAAPGQAGRVGVAAVEKSLSDQYEILKPRIFFKADAQFDRNVSNLKNLVAGMPADLVSGFNHVVSRVETMMGAPRTMDGWTFKEVESELSRLARNYHQSPSPFHRDIGDAINSYLGEIRENMERHSAPSVRPDLKRLNTAWAMFKRVQEASTRRPTGGGVFTPGDLLAAEKKLAGKSVFARGDGLLQRDAEEAQQVLGRTIPDSGTALRYGTFGELAALPAGAIVSPLHTAAVLAGHGLHALAYTSPGMALLRGMAGSGFPAIRNALAAVPRTVSNALAPAAGFLASAPTPAVAANQ